MIIVKEPDLSYPVACLLPGRFYLRARSLGPLLLIGIKSYPLSHFAGHVSRRGLWCQAMTNHSSVALGF